MTAQAPGGGETTLGGPGRASDAGVVTREGRRRGWPDPPGLLGAPPGRSVGEGTREWIPCQELGGSAS